MHMKNSFLVIVMVLIVLTAITIGYNSPIKNSIFNGSNDPLNPLTNFNGINQSVTLGADDDGYVVRGGPYGNVNSTIKVAYIVGVHPREVKAHTAILWAILTQNNLRYCYYIYWVHVTADAYDYDHGRINGQNLAAKYVVPDVIRGNFKMAVDVHSNRGVHAGYKECRFVVSPVQGVSSETAARKIISKIPWLTYYLPKGDKGPKSPKFVTLPLINSGVTSVIYETYMYEPYNVTLEHAEEFLVAVDGLNI
jgi:hypothetical protein